MATLDGVPDQTPPPTTTRDALLAAARDLAASTPWHEVTMARVGADAGVSRQTVYNEFGGKQGLAQAVALSIAGEVLADVLAAMRAPDDLRTSLRDGVRAAFAHADGSPLVKAVLTGSPGPDGLQVVVTTDAMPVLTLAGTAVSGVVRERWPDVAPEQVPALVDSTIRLVVSHLLQPGPTRDQVADHIADLVVAAAGA